MANAVTRNELMKSRVYGVSGVCASCSNINADFNGNPRRLPSGEFYASDKSFKYAIRFYFRAIGELVFNMRSDYFKEGSGKDGNLVLTPRTLKENYENRFNVPDLQKVKDVKEVAQNLFSCIDIKQFGATFAEANKNMGIQGAVQIYQGMNIYENTMEEYQTILSPYKNPNSDKKEKASNEENPSSNKASATTLGLRVFVNEAHYVFPFSVNPSEYDKWVVENVTEGYTVNDYELLRDGINRGVTALDTGSKSGCENEYSVFVKIKEGENLYLPNLSKYVSFKKCENEKDIIYLGFDKILNSVKSKIESVEVYYNQHLLDIIFDFEGAKYIDIISYDEISR